MNAFDTSICHDKSQSKTEYRPDFRSKHFEGIMAAENEKEILTVFLTKRVDENLLWCTYLIVTLYKKVQELAIMSHFWAVI